MKITTIELPIYNVDIVIIISTEWQVVKKKYDLDMDADDLGTCAMTLMYPGDKNNVSEIYLVLRPEYLDYNTILHELLHVVFCVCDLKSIKADVNNDEPLTYLQGYIGEKLFEFRDKYIKDEQAKTERAV